MLEDAVHRWSDKGKVIPRDETQGEERRVHFGGDIPTDYWNETHQWLPANVSFQTNGMVQFTSYINNLHPKEYAGKYRTIKKLVEPALPLWDQCLTPACIRADVIHGIPMRRNDSRFPYPNENENRYVVGT